MIISNNFYKTYNYHLTKKYIYIIFIFLIIFIIILYLNKLIGKDYKEHYLTYFLPYYDNEKNKIQQFYENEDYKRLNYKNNFFNQPFNIGYHSIGRQFLIENISKLLLSSSKIKKCNVIHHEYDINLIKNINNNNIQLSILSVPGIAYYETDRIKELEPVNINLVLKISKRYVFFITKKSKNYDDKITNLYGLSINYSNRPASNR